MRSPKSVDALEELGRVRLSKSFFMREFLYSEIANFYGMQNTPDDPDLAVEVGTHLCEKLLEPLNASFGRIAVRSAYRSPSVNSAGNEKGHSCASNAGNYAGHICDHLDADGLKGATACVVVPWFAEGADWRAMAYWIHNHLPYNSLQFFPKLAAFKISWHETPKRTIHSYIKDASVALAQGEGPRPDLARYYDGFPIYRDPANMPEPR